MVGAPTHKAMKVVEVSLQFGPAADKVDFGVESLGPTRNALALERQDKVGRPLSTAVSYSAGPRSAPLPI